MVTQTIPFEFFCPNKIFFFPPPPPSYTDSSISSYMRTPADQQAQPCTYTEVSQQKYIAEKLIASPHSIYIWNTKGPMVSHRYYIYTEHKAV